MLRARARVIILLSPALSLSFRPAENSHSTFLAFLFLGWVDTSASTSVLVVRSESGDKERSEAEPTTVLTDSGDVRRVIIGVDSGGKEFGGVDGERVPLRRLAVSDPSKSGSRNLAGLRMTRVLLRVDEGSVEERDADRRIFLVKDPGISSDASEGEVD